ncbi:MAG: diacylglycerol/lipid kinase family protein [Jatrophihabitantaceae bacterium]
MATVMTDGVTRADVPANARWLARAAVLCAAAAVAMFLVAGASSLGILLAAIAGLVVTVVGLWWFVSHRGPLRWLGGAIGVLAPLAVLGLCLQRGALWSVLIFAALLVATLALSRAALGLAAARSSVTTTPEIAAPPPRRPYLIMNPRSGGGKVTRFDLDGKATALGAEVMVLNGSEYYDVSELARQAVADHADLLGVAGGDGTQALVAAVAAEHHLPFLVLSAGTRNHFAMDLGLDREDVAAGLDALTDGVELCIDLGDINGRTFVNNASFGAYAEVVQSPAYRDDKRGTTLNMLPDLLSGHRGPRLVAHIDDTVTIEGPTALLVSNNRYDLTDLAGLGRRYHLDQGELGVIAVTVDSAARAAQLISGARGKGLCALTAHEIVIDSDVAEIPVGIDGESVLMPTPVRCRVRPAVLRVRVPRGRPGVPSPGPLVRPAPVVRVALGRS